MLPLPTLLRALTKWMLQAEPALSRSLKNARGASVVHEIIKRKLLNYYAII